MMRRRSGLTLLEVIIASAILAMVLAITFQILFGSTKTASQASITGDLENRSRTLVDFCKLQFLTGKFAGPAPSVGGYAFLGIPNTTPPGTEIRYQIPVDRNAEGVLVYGYTYQIGTGDPAGLGKACILRFEATSALLESAGLAVPPQPAAFWGLGFPAPVALGGPAVRVLNMDINKDGDRLDTFVWGKVVRYVITAGGAYESSEDISDRVLLRFEGGMFYSSMTGTERLLAFFPSTAADAITASGVLINVWHGAFDQSGKDFSTRSGAEGIRFRNRQ